MRKVFLWLRINLKQFFLPDRFYSGEHVSKKYKNCIGKYTYGYPDIIDWGDGAKIKIGNYCSIAGGVKILLGGNHRLDWATTYPFPASPDFKKVSGKIKNYSTSKGDVKIGSDVQIGQNALILSGVKIGDGAVIGTGAVVTHNVVPYSIVAGNPAKEIRKRFDQKTIDKLLKLQWWNWNKNKIKQNISLLCSPEIKKLIDTNE